MGAHPDDEDSALIAQLAREDHARVAYLSLNRGEGGQNVIARFTGTPADGHGQHRFANLLALGHGGE